MNMTQFKTLRLFAVVALLFATPFVAARAQDEAADSDGANVVKFVKELDNGSEIEFEKVGQEPAVARVKTPGKDPVVIDAYDPIETAPEFAQKTILDVWQTLGEIPKKKINIEIDATAAPEAEPWAKRVQSRVEYWSPKVVEMLDGEEALEKIPDDFKIRLVFKPFNGVAYASGREITVSSSYIKSHPNDYGLVIHETTHVAQAYPRVREVWAMEGMTDYIRYFVTEPRSKNTWRVNPKTSKYTDSYGVTASFFNWIVQEKDPEFIRKIHRVFRSSQSVERFSEQEYGATLAELWDEFISNLTNQTRQD